MREFPLDIVPGKIAEIEGIEHVFERIDPDGRMTIPSLRQRVDYLVTDPATGSLVKPTADDIARLMIQGKFILRSAELEVATRDDFASLAHRFDRQ